MGEAKLRGTFWERKAKAEAEKIKRRLLATVRFERRVRRGRLNMGITGGFGTLIDYVTGRPRRWYMRADGIRRWASNDQPCDASNESDMWRCTECGRVGSVGRCCGEETREPCAPNASGNQTDRQGRSG